MDDRQVVVEVAVVVDVVVEVVVGAGLVEVDDDQVVGVEVVDERLVVAADRVGIVGCLAMLQTSRLRRLRPLLAAAKKL